MAGVAYMAIADLYVTRVLHVHTSAPLAIVLKGQAILVYCARQGSADA
jgi:hypothetical protein